VPVVRFFSQGLPWATEDTKPMNEERLKRQIEVLRQIPGQLEMAVWADEPNLEHPCNTACCAFGWAGFDPRLQAEGLELLVRLESEGRERTEIVKTVEQYASLFKNDEWYIDDIEPRFTGFGGMWAASAFYEITYEEATRLFSPSEYHFPNRKVQPKDVIDRIQKLLAGV
jgi:hypothetical protein